MYNALRTNFICLWLCLFHGNSCLTKLILLIAFQVVSFLHLKESMAAYVELKSRWKKFLLSYKVIII